jgi:hypothetical protein
MLTDSRRQTCESSRGSGTLGGRAVADGGDTRRVVGDAYGVCYSQTMIVWTSKPSGGWFSGLGLKTRVEVPRRNGVARGGITEVALRQSKSVQEAWPSDRQKSNWTIMPSG